MSVFCFRFCPHGPPGWLCFFSFFFFFEGGVASDADPGWTASSFLFSPSHCQLQLSHRGTIEKRRGCSLNGKNKLESPPPPPQHPPHPSPSHSYLASPPPPLPKTRHLHLTGPPFSSLHRPFSFSFSFSLPVLSIIPLSLSLSLLSAAVALHWIIFFSGLLLIRIAFFFFFLVEFYL